MHSAMIDIGDRLCMFLNIWRCSHMGGGATLNITFDSLENP